MNHRETADMVTEFDHGCINAESKEVRFMDGMMQKVDDGFLFTQQEKTKIRKIYYQRVLVDFSEYPE